MKRRVFDETFRQMAVELSYAKGSVREAAEEPGIDSGRISKWRQRDNQPAPSGKSQTELTDEQKQIRQLQKQLKEAQLDRTAEAARYIKKGGRHLFQGRPRGGPWEIFRFIKEHASQFPTVRRSYLCSSLKLLEKVQF
ncbi:MAG: transposase [Spirosomataceae bacterium]